MAKNKKTKKANTGAKKPSGLKKQVRSAGAAAAKLADHPVISDIIAAGLLAAAAALTETKQGKRTIKAAGDTADDAAQATVRKAGRVKVAAKAAAGAMGNRILEEVKDAVSGRSKGGKKSD